MTPKQVCKLALKLLQGRDLFYTITNHPTKPVRTLGQELEQASARCRHEQHSWILAGLLYEWCYQCGALRQLKQVSDNELVATSAWVVPTGPKGANPHPMKPLKRKEKKHADNAS